MKLIVQINLQTRYKSTRNNGNHVRETRLVEETRAEQCSKYILYPIPSISNKKISLWKAVKRCREQKNRQFDKSKEKLDELRTNNKALKLKYHNGKAELKQLKEIINSSGFGTDNQTIAKILKEIEKK